MFVTGIVALIIIRNNIKRIVKIIKRFSLRWK
jgi:hypothetical protein